MAQTKPQETRTEACGILFVIEANPANQSWISKEKGFSFEFLLRQPEVYFVAWRWMKSCNALQGALSDFLQTVIHLSFFIVNKSSSYQTTTKQTHFTKLKRYRWL